jgi:hypothetical protein
MPGRTFDEDRANNAVYNALRGAGFEDGIDFRVDQGPASLSPRARIWLSANQTEVMLTAFNESLL